VKSPNIWFFLELKFKEIKVWEGLARMLIVGIKYRKIKIRIK